MPGVLCDRAERTHSCASTCVHVRRCASMRVDDRPRSALHCTARRQTHTHTQASMPCLSHCRMPQAPSAAVNATTLGRRGPQRISASRDRLLGSRARTFAPFRPRTRATRADAERSARPTGSPAPPWPRKGRAHREIETGAHSHVHMSHAHALAGVEPSLPTPEGQPVAAGDWREASPEGNGCLGGRRP